MNFNQSPALLSFANAPFQSRHNPIVPAPPAKRSRLLDLLASQTDADITAFQERYVAASKRAADSLDADPRLLKSYHLHEDKFERWYDKYIMRRKEYTLGPCAAWEMESSFRLAKVLTQYLFWLVENTPGQTLSGRVGADVLSSWAEAVVQLAKVKLVDESKPGSGNKRLAAWYGALEDGSDSLQRLIRVWVEATGRELGLPPHGNPVDESGAEMDAPVAKKSRTSDETNVPSPKESGTRTARPRDEADTGPTMSFPTAPTDISQAGPYTVDDFWASIEDAWDSLPKPRTARCMLLDPDEDVREDHAHTLSLELRDMKKELWKTLRNYSSDNLDAWTSHALTALKALDRQDILAAMQAKDEGEFESARSFVIASGKAYYDEVLASPDMVVSAREEDSPRGFCFTARCINGQRHLVSPGGLFARE